MFVTTVMLEFYGVIGHIGQTVGLVKMQLITQVFGCKILECLKPFQKPATISKPAGCQEKGICSLPHEKVVHIRFPCM